MTRHDQIPEGQAALLLRWACRNNFYAFLQAAFPTVCPGVPFQPAQYLEAMCFALQEVSEGRETRLIVSVAPRHLKSICASVLLPAFKLGHDPTAKIMVISYGGELARDLGMTFRRLVQSPFYQKLFPGTVFDRRADRIEDMRTTKGGNRMSISLGGAMTGKGATLIVLDDLMKASDAKSATMRADVKANFDQSIHSRLNDKRTGAFVSVAQRLHVDDITTYLLEKGTFRHMCLDSIAAETQEFPLYGGRRFVRNIGDILNPDRQSRAELELIREEIRDYAFQAQYLQNPRPGESYYLRREQLAIVPKLPPPSEFTRRTQSWDPASNEGPDSDFSAGITFGWHEPSQRWYVLNVERARLQYPELIDRVKTQRAFWRADRVLIENSSLGIPLWQELSRTAARVYRPVTATEGKTERFIAQTDYIIAGKLVFAADQPWFRDLIDELLAFPNDTHDDQVDAVVQWVKWIRRAQGYYLDTVPETGRRIGNYRRDTAKPEDRMQFD